MQSYLLFVFLHCKLINNVSIIVNSLELFISWLTQNKTSGGWKHYLHQCDLPCNQTAKARKYVSFSQFILTIKHKKLKILINNLLVHIIINIQIISQPIPFHEQLNIRAGSSKARSRYKYKAPDHQRACCAIRWSGPKGHADPSKFKILAFGHTNHLKLYKSVYIEALPRRNIFQVKHIA